jgi:hypothetical protein
MRRVSAMLVPLLLVVPFLAAPAANAKPVAPYQAHPMGRSYTDWTKAVGQFYLGDASNPLIAGLGGDCGQLRNGVFMMVGPIELNAEFDCDVPTGTWIVLSHAGFFGTKGVDGETDAQIEAAAANGFKTSTNHLTLDGANIPLKEISTGAYDVISQKGSFYDTVMDLGTGPIRTALVANVVAIHPLTPGDHTIEAAVTFIGDGAFSATYHIHVG